MKKNPKKPARLWAAWSPTKGFLPRTYPGWRDAQRSAQRAREFMLGTPDWKVVEVRLVKITPRRGRGSK